MILYALRCTKGHEFEAWFANSGAFDAQQKRGLLLCPECASRKVTGRSRLIVGTSRRAARSSEKR